MTNLTLDKEITGLLIICPYNDFISEGGKVRMCQSLISAVERRESRCQVCF
jgi:hypothetical protein